MLKFFLVLALILPFVAANADMGENCDQKYPYDKTYYPSVYDAGNAAECYAEKEKKSKYFIAPVNEMEELSLAYVFGHNTQDIGPQHVNSAARHLHQALDKKQALNRLLNIQK